MHYKHKLHPLAHQDIIESYAWYETSKENLGEEFGSIVDKKINDIVINPHTFGSKSNKNYRETLIEKFPFVIVYKINEIEKLILIVSIHHAKKHPKHKYRK